MFVSTPMNILVMLLNQGCGKLIHLDVENANANADHVEDLVQIILDMYNTADM